MHKILYTKNNRAFLPNFGSDLSNFGNQKCEQQNHLDSLSLIRESKHSLSIEKYSNISKPMFNGHSGSYQTQINIVRSEKMCRAKAVKEVVILKHT